MPGSIHDQFQCWNWPVQVQPRGRDRESQTQESSQNGVVESTNNTKGSSEENSDQYSNRKPYKKAESATILV